MPDRCPRRVTLMLAFLRCMERKADVTWIGSRAHPLTKEEQDEVPP